MGNFYDENLVDTATVPNYVLFTVNFLNNRSTDFEKSFFCRAIKSLLSFCFCFYEFFLPLKEAIFYDF